MTEMLSKLLENDLFNDETKQEIAENFRSLVEEAKAEQEKTLRSEFAERYERDKEKIAEAVQQYVDTGMEKEITEFHVDMKALAEQRIKYVNAQAALKEQAQTAIRHRMSIFEKALRKALVRETKELHEDLKLNRQAALRAITEAKAQAEADRQAFRTKGAKVLEHILKVQNHTKFQALKEDIDKAKQNDFGSRIFEAFMGEARRLFFNSHKELRSMLKRLTEQQQSHAAEKASLLQMLEETRVSAKKAIAENRQIKESAYRAQKTAHLLSTVPANAREKMKVLLESSAAVDLEKTFRKFAPSILNETKGPAPSRKTSLNEGALRTGNGRTHVLESTDDDDDIVNLRRLSGIVRK